MRDAVKKLQKHKNMREQLNQQIQGEQIKDPSNNMTLFFFLPEIHLS